MVKGQNNPKFTQLRDEFPYVEPVPGDLADLPSLVKALRPGAPRRGTYNLVKAEQSKRLEQIAGLSAEEARRELLQRAEDTARAEAAALIRDIKEQAKKSAERDAQRIVAIAIQRIAPDARTASGVAGLDARPDPRLVPWIAENLFHGGRSLSLPLHEDGTASGRADEAAA